MFTLLAASLFFINDPVSTMREEPSSNARVASQAIFSEQIEVGTEQNGWTYIQTPDGYHGWAATRSIAIRDLPYETSATVSRLAAHVYEVNDTEFGPMMTLPFGAKLQVFEDSNPRWCQVRLPDDRIGWIQKGDIAPLPPLQKKQDLVAFSMQFLGLPYTWGGRSSFGYDCSGFIQMLYRQIGIHLQRDAKDQINDERFTTINLDSLEPGDLIFFGPSSKKITHVGMAIGEGKFIHSTVGENKPWIIISELLNPEWSKKPFITARQLQKS